MSAPGPDEIRRIRRQESLLENPVTVVGDEVHFEKDKMVVGRSYLVSCHGHLLAFRKTSDGRIQVKEEKL